MLNVELQINKPTPSYVQLEKALRDAIIARRLSPGSRLPEERELATSLKLSRGTVRKALASLHKDGLLIRHQGRGTFVAQAGELPAVPLAVVIEGGPSRAGFGWLGQLMQALSEAAAKLGADLLLRESADQKGAMLPAACIYLIPTRQEEVRRVAAQGMPVIAVDYLVPGPGVDSVVFDNVRGSAEAVRHLISLGHRRIAYVHAQITREGQYEYETNSAERLEGYRRALREAGIQEEVIWPIPLELQELQRQLPNFLRKPNRPTALFAFDETVAHGALLATQELGLTIPGDLSIASFRQLDLEPRGGRNWTGLGLTLQDMGRAVVEQALQRACGSTGGSLFGHKPSEPVQSSEGKVIYVPYRWVLGDTCIPPKSEK